MRTPYYYTTGWQVLEEWRETLSDGNKENAAGYVYGQYVWSARYIDAPVCRDQDIGDGNRGDGLGDPDGDCTDAADGARAVGALAGGAKGDRCAGRWLWQWHF